MKIALGNRCRILCARSLRRWASKTTIELQFLCFIYNSYIHLNLFHQHAARCRSDISSTYTCVRPSVRREPTPNIIRYFRFFFFAWRKEHPWLLHINKCIAIPAPLIFRADWPRRPSRDCESSSRMPRPHGEMRKIPLWLWMPKSKRRQRRKILIPKKIENKRGTLAENKSNIEWALKIWRKYE